MKIKLNKGLKLSKESLSKLQESQMIGLKGGMKNLKHTVASCGDNSCNGFIREE